MKTILVPVDYSPNSKSALLYALKLAQKASLNVIVFHAFHPMASPPAAYEIPSVIPQLEKEKVLELEQYVKNCKSVPQEDVIISYKVVEGTDNLKDTPAQERNSFHSIAVDKVPPEKYAAPVTYVAKMGTVYEQIIKVAEANKVELIVMGMQGGGALSQVLIGSTTLSVMRNCSVPVLGVPLGVKYAGLKSVVFASDLSKQLNKFLLAKLREFVKTFRSRLQVLHISKQHHLQADDAYLQPALEMLDTQLYDIDFNVVLQQREDATRGIQEYLQEHKPDLLILNPQKHSMLERLLDMSVTSKMMAYNHLPLLALPTGKNDHQPIIAEELENTDNY